MHSSKHRSQDDNPNGWRETAFTRQRNGKPPSGLHFPAYLRLSVPVSISTPQHPQGIILDPRFPNQAQLIKYTKPARGLELVARRLVNALISINTRSSARRAFPNQLSIRASPLAFNKILLPIWELMTSSRPFQSTRVSHLTKYNIGTHGLA